MERLQKKLDDEKQKRNATEARLNRTKSLDDLEEQKETLKHQIEENRQVIQDENTSPSETEAAEARVEQGEEELARLYSQIQQREEALPWRERIKNRLKSGCSGRWYSNRRYITLYSKCP